jgi:hypothetical protein
VRSGIKDLDLALKERPELAPQAERLLVLCDVPASFVQVPDDLVERTRFLLASPPLPPSGAYRFGSRHIVGLARREAAPAPAEIAVRMPELRVIELRARPGGGVVARDLTDRP